MAHVGAMGTPGPVWPMVRAIAQIILQWIGAKHAGRATLRRSSLEDLHVKVSYPPKQLVPEKVEKQALGVGCLVARS